jgi:hypothetical protein
MKLDSKSSKNIIFGKIKFGRWDSNLFPVSPLKPGCYNFNFKSATKGEVLMIS